VLPHGLFGQTVVVNGSPQSHLDLARVRDLEGRRAHPLWRRAVLTVLAVLVALALAGVFGQPTNAVEADAPGATLHVELPDALRGGLLWRARLVVSPKRTIREPRLILGPGFATGMQLNTIEPSPASESSRGDRLVLSYDELAPGDKLVLYLQLQVNPTTLGSQDTSVALDDATTPVVRISHSTTVFP
jgi:hypothetical protein